MVAPIPSAGRDETDLAMRALQALEDVQTMAPEEVDQLADAIRADINTTGAISETHCNQLRDLFRAEERWQKELRERDTAEAEALKDEVPVDSDDVPLVEAINAKVHDEQVAAEKELEKTYTGMGVQFTDYATAVQRQEDQAGEAAAEASTPSKIADIFEKLGQKQPEPPDFGTKA